MSFSFSLDRPDRPSSYVCSSEGNCQLKWTPHCHLRKHGHPTVNWGNTTPATKAAAAASGGLAAVTTLVHLHQVWKVLLQVDKAMMSLRWPWYPWGDKKGNTSPVTQAFGEIKGLWLSVCEWCESGTEDIHGQGCGWQDSNLSTSVWHGFFWLHTCDLLPVRGWTGNAPHTHCLKTWSQLVSLLWEVVVPLECRD